MQTRTVKFDDLCENMLVMMIGRPFLVIGFPCRDRVVIGNSHTLLNKVDWPEFKVPIIEIASGDELDSIATMYGVGRLVGCSDSELRDRLLAAYPQMCDPGISFNFNNDPDGFYSSIRLKGVELMVPTHSTCNHQWMPIQLSFKTVYDCKICGAKQEDLNG
jgi:hypothetical protein